VTSETNAEFITLARVTKTQGRQGEVAAEIHTDVPGRFTVEMKLFALLGKTVGGLKDTRRELTVEDLWPHKGLLVLKFLGVDSISQAEALVGCELQVPRYERAPLEQGWNYVSDLLGCAVVNDGAEIGCIEDVQFGAGEAPLLIVANRKGKKFDIPFAEAFLEAVDLANKQVRMRLPEGMLEVNAPMTAEEKQQQSNRKKRH
jgi:16S rRNA processing protein RimM